MRHLDLFSGIGGFAYAADQVWDDVQHIFVENDPFCQKVLQKHWSDSIILGDIKELSWSRFVRDAKQRSEQMAEATVVLAKTPECENGEPTTTPVVAKTKATGIIKTLKKAERGQGIGIKNNGIVSLTTMAQSATAAESQNESSSPLTTSTMTEQPNAELTELKYGKQSSKKASLTSINSSATTATWQRLFTDNAHTEIKVDLLTGGFPCQPFSQAGKRKGTDDNRHLWPQMLRIIQEVKPTWVIAENVRGLLTWDNGVQYEQVCVDLESAGYEVQPFIIPAVAVNAPHRRDRVWFVAHKQQPGLEGRSKHPTKHRKDKGTQPRPEGATHATHTNIGQSRPRNVAQPREKAHAQLGTESTANWSRNWLEVATQFCSVDDGLSVKLDGFKLSKSQHRKEQVKAYGNAIVPQIAVEIMQGMAQNLRGGCRDENN